MANKEGWFLRSANMESYGGFSDASVGPFAPGMNVVYGPNESGKTTLTSFIGGVLFGWPDARSKKNVYKPVNAQRSGSLTFEDALGNSSAVSRSRNADGLVGDEAFVDDIDAETYSAMFSLNSDELLKLDGAADMTSRLLTAGCGTAVSPAKALENLDARIAAYTSKSAAAPYSITNLTAQREELAAKIGEFQQQMDACQAEEGELRQLKPAAVSLQANVSALNKLVEKLTHAKASLLGNGKKRESLVAKKTGLSGDAQEAAQQRDALQAAFKQASGVETLDAAKERAVRNALEDMETQTQRLEAAAEAAKNDCLTSSSQYQVLADAREKGEGMGRTPFRRVLMLGFTVLFPLASLAAGVFCLVWGTQNASLFITSMGVMLVLFAVALAGGVAIVSLRPNKKAQVFQKRLEDAEWVMLQDEKKLHLCLEDLERHNEKVASYLSFNGLAAAEGSIRRARALLDDMRDNRQQVELAEQRRSGIVSQLADANREEQELRLQDAQTLKECDCESAEQLDALISNAQESRDDANRQLQEAQKRIGELQQKLDSARGQRDFDDMKLQKEQVEAQLARSKYDYACLLLARKRLADAISVWEGESQPAVLAMAGRFLSQMTDGAWVKVQLGDDGDMTVLDVQGRQRTAALLSTGTCQQLYLALRMALLLTASNVGSRIPVLADDILVNFDNARRVNTAKALLELSRSRQIIFMTCHQEIADLLVQLDADVNLIRLGKEA